MNIHPFPPKYYMVFGIAFLLIFVGVSCSLVSATPASTPIIQTVEVNREVTREVTRIVKVLVTVTPTPTSNSAPLPVNSQEPIPGLAGKWLDPDTLGGTITTIAWENGQYVVKSVINPSRGGNEVTKSSWSNGVLTWAYCIPNANCITTVTVSVNGDRLDTTWTDDTGKSGETTFIRVP